MKRNFIHAMPRAHTPRRRLLCECVYAAGIKSIQTRVIVNKTFYVRQFVELDELRQRGAEKN